MRGLVAAAALVFALDAVAQTAPAVWVQGNDATSGAGGDIVLQPGLGSGSNPGGRMRFLPIQVGAVGKRTWLSELIWSPVDSDTSPHMNWAMSLAGFPNIGLQNNQVFQMGFNLNPGAGRLNLAYSGFRDAWEQYYEPSTAGVGYHERHIAVVPTDSQTQGEVRVFEIYARANVPRDQVVPQVSITGSSFLVLHPSKAAGAFTPLAMTTGSAPNYFGRLNVKYIAAASNSTSEDLVLMGKGSGNVSVGGFAQARSSLDIRASQGAGITLGSRAADMGGGATLGSIDFFNSDTYAGTSQGAVGAQIKATTGSSFGTGGELRFYTAKDGNTPSPLVENMKIAKDGNFVIGNDVVGKLYTEAGALKFKGANGTITVLAPP